MLLRVVLFLTTFLPNWAGGTEIATHSLAVELAKLGHEVHVVAALDNGLPEDSIVDGYFIHRIRRSDTRILGVLLFWIRSLAFIIRTKPDIVHVQDLGNSPLGFVSRLCAGRTYIVWAQGSDVYSPSRLGRAATFVALALASTVLVLTEDMKRCLSRIYNGEIQVVTNGVDLSGFAASHSLVVRDKGQLTAIYVGSLIPVKGVEHLISAFGLLRGMNVNCVLMIVGDGQSRHILERQVANLGLRDVVRFVGRVPHDQIPRYLSESSIFTLPSLSEGMPLVILESFAAGLPIVATNVRGISEIVRDGENGLLVPPRDPNALAEAIRKLVADDELRLGMSVLNIQRSREFNWSVVARRIEEVYTRSLVRE